MLLNRVIVLQVISFHTFEHEFLGRGGTRRLDGGLLDLNVQVEFEILVAYGRSKAFQGKDVIEAMTELGSSREVCCYPRNPRRILFKPVPCYSPSCNFFECHGDAVEGVDELVNRSSLCCIMQFEWQSPSPLRPHEVEVSIAHQRCLNISKITRV